MTMKRETKFEAKLTLDSKNGMSNFVGFDACTGTFEICTLMCCFCQQHIKFQLKKYRRIISHDTENDRDFEETLTFI